MRIDQALHWLCLVKSRSLAARACREGRVLIDDEPVRPAREARAGEQIRLLDPSRTRGKRITLREVPTSQVSRKQAGDYYHVDQVEKLDEVNLTWNEVLGAEDE